MTLTATGPAAETPLHRADPRLKLLCCGGLAILAFAAGNWLRLAMTAVALAGLLVCARCTPGWLLRTLWPLRWLLLFTLLLHLLLSPGETLLGVAWLSRDGLRHGLLVCAQVGVAALAAALLATTTSAGQIALASGWLLSPLGRLGCPVRRWQELVVLVLRFFPVLSEELLATRVAGSGRWRERIVAWGERLLPLFDRLVARADLLAHRIVAGEECLLPEEPPPARSWRTGIDPLLLAGGVMLSMLYLLAGT